MYWADQGLCENYNILYPSEWGTSRVDSPYQRNLPGDPLFPFLFLLHTKGLHGLIQQAARAGYKGSSLHHKGPELTHLLFTDDSLLFCRVTTDEYTQLLGILDCYESVLGQKVNKNKTPIFFSKSTTEDTKQEIKTTLGIQELVHYEQYLGLPSLVGKRKKKKASVL